MKKTSFPFLKALVVYAEDALDKVTNIDLVCQFCFRLLIWYIRSFYLLQQHDHFRTILWWSLTIFVFFDKFSLYHFFYLISKCVLVATTREFFLFLNHVICMALLTASKQYWNGLAFWRTCFHLPFIMVDNLLWPYLYLCLFPLPTFFFLPLFYSLSPSFCYCHSSYLSLLLSFFFFSPPAAFLLSFIDRNDDVSHSVLNLICSYLTWIEIPILTSTLLLALPLFSSLSSCPDSHQWLHFWFSFSVAVSHVSSCANSPPPFNSADVLCCVLCRIGTCGKMQFPRLSLVRFPQCRIFRGWQCIGF